MNYTQNVNVCLDQTQQAEEEGRLFQPPGTPCLYVYLSPWPPRKHSLDPATGSQTTPVHT
jgi:hypothetical protein